MFMFDLDGTLLDDEDMIAATYHDIGVDPPPNFMALSSEHVLTDHQRLLKDAAYVRRMATDPVIFRPSWETAELLHKAHETVGILSGAPRRVLGILGRKAASWPFSFAVMDQSPDQKEKWMAGQAGGGTYVDNVRNVTTPHGWRFVLYKDQTAEELFRQLAG
jgi:beta-phosphoglucomutase-like phosphatase (HAD superfamily)